MNDCERLCDVVTTKPCLPIFERKAVVCCKRLGDAAKHSDMFSIFYHGFIERAKRKLQFLYADAIIFRQPHNLMLLASVRLTLLVPNRETRFPCIDILKAFFPKLEVRSDGVYFPTCGSIVQGTDKPIFEMSFLTSSRMGNRKHLR